VDDVTDLAKTSGVDQRFDKYDKVCSSKDTSRLVSGMVEPGASRPVDGCPSGGSRDRCIDEQLFARRANIGRNHDAGIDRDVTSACQPSAVIEPMLPTTTSLTIPANSLQCTDVGNLYVVRLSAGPRPPYPAATGS